MKNGFARLFRKWKKGDVIELVLPMPVRRVIAPENVAADRGKAALQRGPIVYCFEGVDNNGQVLNRFLPDKLDFEVEFKPQLLGGIDVLAAKDTEEDIQLVAIPYYAWSHRGIGEMAVWLTRKKGIVKKQP